MFEDENLSQLAGRTVPLQVLALGIPRTGTLTMRLALESLGYAKTHHGYDLIFQQETSMEWSRLVDAKWDTPGSTSITREMFDAVLGEYMAIADCPAVYFARDLIEAYPEAKVILVDRDLDSWLKPFTKIIRNLFSQSTTGKPSVAFLQKLYSHVFHSTTPEGILANAPEVFSKHYADIRRTVAAARLLEYRPAEGWAPLCEFLSKDVPAMPFPQEDESEALQRRTRLTQPCSFSAKLTSNSF